MCDLCEITIIDATSLSLDMAVESTVETHPDIVGVTTMGLSSVKPVCDFVSMFRSLDKNTILLAGGHGATLSPQSLLKAGIDAVVLGEGEVTLRELIVKGVSEELMGLVLLRKGELILTPPRPLIEPLDNLQEPARHLAPPSPKGVALIETSRGCPNSCKFCSVPVFCDNKWRGRSAEVVVRDIGGLVSNHALIIHIVDDNFTARPHRALQICKLLKDGPLPLFFVFSGRTDDLLQLPELIPKLGESHFLRAAIGVETLEPDLAESIGKPLTMDVHKRAFRALRKEGIFTVGSFIIGLPGETEDMRQRCVKLAVEVGVDSAQFIPFQSIPGTPLGGDSIEPESWCIEYARHCTVEFRRNEFVLKRLIESARKNTVHGMLSRASLVKWLEECIFPPSEAKLIEQELKCIDPDFLFNISNESINPL